MPKVTLRRDTWKVGAGITVRDAIRKAGQQPESVLALLNGQLVHEEAILEEGDALKLIAVITGG